MVSKEPIMTMSNGVPNPSVSPDAVPTHDDRPTVVVGVDCSATSPAVLAAAAEFADRLGARLHAVFVYLPARSYAGPWPIAVPHTDMQVHMDGVLGDIVRRTFDGRPPEGFVASAVEGDPLKTLLAVARKAEALVVGVTGHSGLTKLVLGSVSAACVEHATVPVYVVHTSASDAP